MFSLIYRKVMGFLLMLSFFTRLPFGKWVEYNEERYKDGLVMFPLVGLVTGGFVMLPLFLLNRHDRIPELMVIFAYILITGGIHLDGLADSFDGLFSGRNRERILEIMKDSHIGTFGVISLILYFLSFYEVTALLNWRWIFLMPFVGKTMGYYAASISAYAPKDQGMGYIFISEIGKISGLFFIVLSVLIVTVVLGSDGFIALVSAFCVTHLLIDISNIRIGGQTGDTIGMIIETSQMAFLIAGGLLWGL